MNISKTWDVDPLEFLPKVQGDIVDLTVTIAERIFDGVVSRTPVYTGNLRASWVVGVGENYYRATGGSPSNVLPPPTFPAGLRSMKPQLIYIMNTTPYAGLVEFGGPKNIPRAMVQQTLSAL
jgi:hypothetical protein